MKLTDLHDSIITKIQEEFNKLKHTHENFPFYIHIHTTGNGFYVEWSLSKLKSYCTHPGNNTVALMRCEIIRELYMGEIMLTVYTHRMKSYQGERSDPNASYNPHNHDWKHNRHDPFLVAADSRILWQILESSADLSKVVKEVMEI